MMKYLTVGVLLCILFSGCRTTYVAQRYPIIEMPTRPVIQNLDLQHVHPQTRERLGKHFDALINYSQTLEQRIQKYNAFASDKNIKNNYKN